MEMYFLQRREKLNADRNNFYKNSFADFVSCKKPDRNPDYISSSGSKYWYENDGVIRESDHFGKVSSCEWTLNNADFYSDNTSAVGFCSLNAFYDVDLLMFMMLIY